VLAARSRPDLDEHDRLPVAPHDVDLRAAQPDVACEQVPAEGLQSTGDGLLGGAAEGSARVGPSIGVATLPSHGK